MCDADGGGDEDVYWHGTQGGFGEVVGERLHMPCLHYVLSKSFSCWSRTLVSHRLLRELDE